MITLPAQSTLWQSSYLIGLLSIISVIITDITLLIHHFMVTAALCWLAYKLALLNHYRLLKMGWYI